MMTGAEQGGGFIRPDWDAPIDLELLYQAMPHGSTAKGVFFKTPCRMAAKRTGSSIGRDSYSIFSDYPVRELSEVLVECSQIVYPGVALRKALRLMGQKVYENIRDTTAGGLMIKMAGGKLMAALNVTGRIYSLFSSDTTAQVSQLSDNEAVVSLRDSWTFPDSYHVGIFEGALTAFMKQGVVHVRSHSLCDVDLKITFT